MTNKASLGTLMNDSSGTWAKRMIEGVPCAFTIWKDTATGYYYAEANTATGSDYAGSTDGAAVIQSAIDGLPSGGKIHFKQGTYTGLSDLTIDANDVYLEGEGPMTTILEFTTAGTNCIKFGTSGGAARSCGGISELQIKNTAAYTNGILTYNHGTHIMDTQVNNQSTMTCGIRVDGGNASGYSLYNYLFRTDIYNATTGLQTQNYGNANLFGGTISNCTTGMHQVTGGIRSYLTHVNYCTTGFRLEANNAAILAPIQEGNTTDVLFDTTALSAIVDFIQGSPVVTDNSVGKSCRWRELAVGEFRRVMEHHTADDTLIDYECGSVHTNLGAGGNIKLTLPQNATKGCYFDFAVMDTDQLQVDPGAAGAIYINGAKQADDAYIWADDEGESVRLICDGNGDWVALWTQGTWTVV